MWYLFGIVGDSQTTDYGPIGFADPCGKKQVLVKAIPFNDIAIIVSQIETWSRDESNKADLLKKLLVHQKTLETVMQQQLAIPIKFGMVVKSKADILIIIEKYYALFKKALQEMDGKMEAAITVSWDTKDQLEKIVEEDKKLQVMQHEARTNGMQTKAVIKIGRILQQRLEEERVRIASEILQDLESVSKVRVDHERMEDKMILNSSFLLPKKKEQELMDHIYKLDKQFHEKFYFKCLSPLPPHSFRTIVIRQIPAERLEEMIVLFGVQENTTLDDLKKKNRELTQRYHPDTTTVEKETPDVEFSQIHQSFDLLKSFYKTEERPFASLDKDRCFLTSIVEGAEIASH